MRKLGDFSIRVKLPLMLAGIVLVSILGAQIVGSIHVKQAVQKTAQERLQSVWTERADILRNWAGDIERDVFAHSRNPFVLTAFRGYRKGWGKTVSDTSFENARDLMAQAFGADDPVAVLNNQALTFALVERRYGAYFDETAMSLGYANILMVDLDGTILFSQVAREDIGMSVRDYPRPKVADTFDQIVNHDPSIEIQERWIAPSPDWPGFIIGVPLVSEASEIIGTLFFEVPLSSGAKRVAAPAVQGADTRTQLFFSNIAISTDQYVTTSQTVDHFGEVVVFSTPVQLKVTQGADKLLEPLRGAYRALIFDKDRKSVV